MEITSVATIFWILVFVLFFIFFSCLYATNRIINKKQKKHYTINRRRLNEREKADLESLRLSKERLLKASDFTQEYVGEKLPMPKKKSFLDKFRSSKTDRKQKPSSGATPAVKSLKSRN